MSFEAERKEAIRKIDRALAHLSFRRPFFGLNMDKDDVAFILGRLTDAVEGLTTLAESAVYGAGKQPDTSPPANSPVCAACEKPVSQKLSCYGLRVYLCLDCLSKLVRGVEENAARTVRREVAAMINRIWPTTYDSTADNNHEGE